MSILENIAPHNLIKNSVHNFISSVPLLVIIGIAGFLLIIVIVAFLRFFHSYEKFAIIAVICVVAVVCGLLFSSGSSLSFKHLDKPGQTRADSSVSFFEALPMETSIENEKKYVQDNGTLYIRIFGKDIYVSNIKCTDEDNIFRLIDALYHDNIKVYIVIDYSDALAVEQVFDVLKEYGINNYQIKQIGE